MQKIHTIWNNKVKNDKKITLKKIYKANIIDKEFI